MTRRSRKNQSGDPAQLDGPPPLVEGVEWASAAEQRRQDWYLPGAIPGGSITLLEGRKSTGKSTIAAAIVAAVTGGREIPGWTGPRDGRAYWIAGEEPWETVVVPRLDAVGADVRRVGRLSLRDSRGNPRRCVLPDDIVILQDAIREAGVRALVLDPYISLAHTSLDMRVEQQARIYLESLAATLAATSCVGILIRHLRKGRGGDAREAGLGSVAVANVARSLIRCDEHPHIAGRWVMSVIACNSGRKLPTQVYRIVEHEPGRVRVEWDGACEIDADAIAEGRGSEAERGEWTDADQILVSVIGNGWAPYRDLASECAAAGVTERMLRRAGERLRVTKRRMQVAGKGWSEWGPPSSGWPAALLPTPPDEPDGGARTQGGRVGLPAPQKRKKTPRIPVPAPLAPPRACAPPPAPLEEPNNGQS
ncbi:MAG: AAA family ATPase [Terriglobales bacterium]